MCPAHVHVHVQCAYEVYVHVYMHVYVVYVCVCVLDLGFRFVVWCVIVQCTWYGCLCGLIVHAYAASFSSDYNY